MRYYTKVVMKMLAVTAAYFLIKAGLLIGFILLIIWLAKILIL